MRNEKRVERDGRSGEREAAAVGEGRCQRRGRRGARRACEDTPGSIAPTRVSRARGRSSRAPRRSNPEVFFTPKPTNHRENERRTTGNGLDARAITSASARVSPRTFLMQRGEVTPGSSGALPHHPLHAVPAREEDRSGHRSRPYSSAHYANQRLIARALPCLAQAPQVPHRTASLCARGDRRRVGLDLAAPTCANASASPRGFAPAHKSESVQRYTHVFPSD